MATKTKGAVAPTNNTSPNVRTELVDGAVQNVRNALAVEFGEADAALADELGINLASSPNVRTERAVMAYNQATRHMVEAGVLLASVRAEVGPEAFVALLEERGMRKQRAYELMQGAAFVARVPADQRHQILSLPKTKVMALANAEPEVVQAMLEDGEVDVDALSVRDLRQRIRELESGLTDTQVQRDTAQAELEAARKRLAQPHAGREDQVPLVVADLRAEIVAGHKKAELAVESFAGVGADLAMLVGTDAAHTWTDGTARMAISALAALRLQVDGQIARWLSLLPEGEDSPVPTATSYLSEQELAEAAQAYAQIIAVHDHERALRDWERQQARPAGRGRPKDKPEAPVRRGKA